MVFQNTPPSEQLLVLCLTYPEKFLQTLLIFYKYANIQTNDVEYTIFCP